MSSGVKRARRRRSGGSGSAEDPETRLQRHRQETAALAPGDPLRYAFELPLDELRSLRRALEPVLERRPSVRRVFEAIIGYKEREIERHRAREGRQFNG